MGLSELNHGNLRAAYEEGERKTLLEWLKRCKYIGFDADGTLIDPPINYYQRVAPEAFRRLLKDLQENIPELRNIKPSTIKGLVDLLKVNNSAPAIAPRVIGALRALQPDISDEFLTAQVNAYWKALYEIEHGNSKNLRTRVKTAGPYDVDSLKPLQEAGKVLFLISNVAPDILNGYQDAIRFHTGITFSFALTPWIFTNHDQMKKPNIQLFEYAVINMQGLGLMDPTLSFKEIMRQTAYVGDETSDLLFAQNAGALGVWMKKVGEPPKEHAKLGPYLTFGNCGEIVQAILK